MWNDTAISDNVMDLGAFQLVSAEYLGSDVVEPPPWLNYFREWGPKIDYNVNDLNFLFMIGKLWGSGSKKNRCRK